MTKQPKFSPSFTIPLVDEKESDNIFDKEEKTQIIIIRNSHGESSKRNDFSNKFIQSIPFKNEKTGVSSFIMEKAPNWSNIVESFPQSYFIMIIGFSYLDLGLQIRPKAFIIQNFRGRYLLRTPPLEEWMDNKQIKLQIWNELKRVPGLEKSGSK
jgi:hypothetical protein